MTRLRLYLSLVSISLLLSLIHCGKKPEVVAKVENQEITAEQFRKVLKDQFKTEDLSTISFETKKETLDELIKQRLKTLKARKLGLDSDPEFLFVREKKIDQLIYQKLIGIEIIDKLVPNRLLKKYFNWQKLEVSVAQILIGHRGSIGYQGTRTEEEAKNVATEVAEKLKTAESPEEIAAEYSDDPMVERNKGTINAFPIGRYSPKVDEAVFTAEPGDVVGPFHIAQGWVVLKILQKRERTGKSDFEKVRDQLKQKLFRHYFTDEANKRREELTDEFMKKHDALILSGNIPRFSEILQEWNKKPENNDLDFTEEEREVPLAKIDDRFITAGMVIDQFQGRFYKMYPRYNSEQKLGKLIQQMLVWEVWITEAKKRGLQNDPDIIEEVEDFSKIQLARLLEQREVRDKVEITEEDIIAQYEKNKDKYSEPARIQIWEIAMESEKLANSIAKRARAGENFENLAQQYTEKENMRAVKGQLGYQTRRTSHPEVVERAFKAGPHKIVGPYKYGIYYYVIKTGEYIPPEQKGLEEVKGIIQSGIQRRRANERREELMEQIRKEFSIQINDSILRSLS